MSQLKDRLQARIRDSRQCWGCQVQAFLFDLPAPVVSDFEAISHVTAYPRGFILFMQLQDLRGIYLLRSGRVKLSITSRHGRILTLRVAKPGEVLGLSDVLLGNSSQMTAETLQSSELEFVARNDFIHILAKHQCVLKNVAQQLAFQNYAAYEQIRMIGLGLSVRDKVARFLLHWIAEEAQIKQSKVVSLALSHEEIAACIGVTRESVTRTFHKFKRLGLVERRRRTWVIPRPDAIRDFLTSHADSRESDYFLPRHPLDNFQSLLARNVEDTRLRNQTTDATMKASAETRWKNDGTSIILTAPKR